MTDQTAPVPGSDEYNAAMVAKMDGTAPAEPTPPQDLPADEPDAGLIGGKFKSQDDLLKAYEELQAKLGQPKEETQEGHEDTQTGNDVEDTAQQVVTDAGLDFDALSNEFNTKGSLSDETYKALEAKGITRGIVDQYIAGQQAIVEKLQLTAFAVVGGEENYSAMIDWASANMSEAEIDAFNTAVNATNPDIIKMAVMGLKGRFEADQGSEPSLIGGGQSGSVGDVFESWHQVTKAMQDPRYSKDPAYRRDVENKLGRSNPTF